ncbi:hypothetical protein D9M70_652480 [compost metagenome]
MAITVGVVAQEPVFEQRRYFQRQAQEDVACFACALRIGGIQNALNFMIVDAGNDRPHHHIGRNASIGELTNSLQAQGRRRCAWLHRAGKIGVKRGD